MDLAEDGAAAAAPTSVGDSRVDRDFSPLPLGADWGHSGGHAGHPPARRSAENRHVDDPGGIGRARRRTRGSGGLYPGGRHRAQRLAAYDLLGQRVHGEDHDVVTGAFPRLASEVAAYQARAR